MLRLCTYTHLWILRHDIKTEKYETTSNMHYLQQLTSHDHQHKSIVAPPRGSQPAVYIDKSNVNGEWIHFIFSFTMGYQ